VQKIHFFTRTGMVENLKISPSLSTLKSLQGNPFHSDLLFFLSFILLAGHCLPIRLIVYVAG
jgi:hypothetical protein